LVDRSVCSLPLNLLRLWRTIDNDACTHTSCLIHIDVRVLLHTLQVLVIVRTRIQCLFESPNRWVLDRPRHSLSSNCGQSSSICPDIPQQECWASRPLCTHRRRDASSSDVISISTSRAARRPYQDRCSMGSSPSPRTRFDGASPHERSCVRGRRPRSIHFNADSSLALAPCYPRTAHSACRGWERSRR